MGEGGGPMAKAGRNEHLPQDLLQGDIKVQGHLYAVHPQCSNLQSHHSV